MKARTEEKAPAKPNGLRKAAIAKLVQSPHRDIDQEAEDRARGGVQSLGRAFSIMEEVARHRDGIGLADFTTARLVRDLDMKATYINALTSLGLPTVKIPIYFETDRETIQHAVASLACDHPERLRIVRVSDTLNINRLLVSEPCLASMRSDPGVSIAGEPQPMRFDTEGNLLPF